MALTDKLTAIGDAIREKTGTVAKLTLDEMPGMISLISGGGDSVEKFINFYDWDGTLLHQFTLPEFSKLEGMPDGPDNLPGYSFAEWNYDFPTIISMNNHVNVAAIYTRNADDEEEVEDVGEPVYVDNTKLRIRLIRPMTVTLNIRQSISNGVSIYWGDGESSGAGVNYGSSNISVSHSYTEPGDYEITFIVADGCVLTLGIASTYTNLIGSSNSVHGGLVFLSEVEIDTRTTSVSSGAFRYCYNLERVVFGDGTNRTIPSYAFQCCYSLGIVELNHSITTIDSYAFESCFRIRSLKIPSVCKTLGTRAFAYCRSLRGIEVWAETIGSGCFRTCPALVDVCLKHTVKTISSYAFTEDEFLESIILPYGLKSFGTYAFQNCYALTHVDLPLELASIPAYTFSGCSMLQNIVLPNNVGSIGSNAFSGCTALSFVGFPKKTISIESSAFINCASLRNAVFSQNLQTIQSQAFMGCTALEYIVIPSSAGSVSSRAFNNAMCVKNVVIPSAISEINAMLTELYPYSKHLKNIYDTMLASSMPIRDYAFHKCLYLEKAPVNGAVESIGSYAFANNPVLRSTALPYGLKTIGAYSFSGDYQLRDVSLPENLTSLGSYAFQSCKGLDKMVFPETIKTAGQYVLNGAGVKKVTVKSGTFTLSAYALYGCRKLKEIVTPGNGTLTIENLSLAVTALEEVKNLPTGTIINGQEIFENCKALYSADLSNADIRNSSYLFRYCHALSEVILPDTLTAIGMYMFEQCYSLLHINLPRYISTINSYAFYNCHNLREINLGENLISIYENAFYNCYSLREVKIPPTVSTLRSPFPSCMAMEKIWLYPTDVPSSNSTSIGGSFRSNYVIYVPKGHLDAYSERFTSHAGHFEEFEYMQSNRQHRSKYVLLSDTSCTVKSTFYHSYFDEDQTFTISAQYDGTNLESIENLQFDFVKSEISFDFTRSENFDYAAVDNLNIHIAVDGKDIACDMSVSLKYLDHDLYLEYEVIHVSGYRFTEQSDGYWKSGNGGINSSYSLCKLTFRTSSPIVYLDCYNSGENGCDFGIVSNLDCVLSSSTNVDSGSTVKRNFNGFNGNETLEYSIDDADEHFIYCKFRKDGSVHSGADCFKFKLRSLHEE